MSRHIPRLFIDEALAVDMQLSLPSAQVHHLVNVLRLRVNDPLVLFNGRGGEYPSRVIEQEKRSVRVQTIAHTDVTREAPVSITLAQGMARGERMDIAIQKAVELGVDTVQPLNTHHSQKLPPDRLEKKQLHWQAVAQSAAEQSGRTRVPEISAPLTLPAWLPSLEGIAATRWVLDPGAHQGLGSQPPAAHCYLLIGPESGLTAEEIRLANDHGFTGVRLGPRILRTETAGMAAIAAIQSLWGDLAG